MEFIVGKWYKNPGSFHGSDKIFAKFLSWEGSFWAYSERIDIRGTVFNTSKSNCWFYDKANPVYEPLTDEELMKVLPPDHPDRPDYPSNKITFFFMTRDEIVQEALVKYPPGTVYIPAHLREVKCTRGGGALYWDQDELVESRGNLFKNGHSYSELFYSEKYGWAKIISTPEQTKFFL